MIIEDFRYHGAGLVLTEAVKVLLPVTLQEAALFGSQEAPSVDIGFVISHCLLNASIIEGLEFLDPGELFEEANVNGQ
jgi:hypothetical protein